MMTERKRSLETDTKMQDEVGVLTKRKKNRDDDKTSQAEKEFDYNLEQMIDMESIRNFQKEAIWRQMNEYKRESLRDKARVKEVEEKQLEWAERIGQLCSIWEETADKLKECASGAVPGNEPTSQDDRWFQLITSDVELQGTDLKSPEELVSSTEKLKSKTKELFSLYELIISNNTDKDFNLKPDSLDQKKCKDSDYFKLQSRLDLAVLQLKESRRLLEQREEELHISQRKCDRALCPISNALDSGKTIESLDSSENPTKVAESPQTESLHTNHLELATLQKISDGRLLEIKRLSEECTKLKLKIDKINIEISSFSKEHIANHPAYISLESEKEYYRADSIQQRTEIKKVSAELEELKAYRRTYQAQLQTQEISQRQVLEQSLQKVQQDLMRVRSHRDQIQRELEERRMHDTVEMNSHLELQNLANARRERMIALVLENRRLRAHVSAMTGNEDAVDFYTSPPVSEDISVTEELRLEIQKLKEKLCDAQSKGADDSVNTSKEAGNESKPSLQPDIISPLINGMNVSAKKTSESGRLPTKSNTDIKELLRIALLEKEELEKTSSLMEHEMQAIISGFSELEEQVTHKVLNLTSKEQMIHKLIAEKAKYEEKFLALNKEREAQKGSLSSLRFQNMKQLEHIKNVDERERNLNQQLALLEQHLLSLRSDQAKCIESLQDAANSIEMLKSQLSVTEKNLQSTAELLQTRTEEADKFSYELTREKENLLQIQRKLEILQAAKDKANTSTNNVPSLSDGNLSELVEQYKALLKCSTCRRNFKNYALTRCMHVFCKDCIDARIETRQRKCPTCGDPFGVNDVRQIFL